jgi:MYXO-CTERM domain-containing protein
VDGPPPPPGSDICGNVGGGSGGTNIPLCDPNDDAGGRWCDGSIPDDAATPTPDAGPVTPSFDFAAWCAAGGFSVDDSANCGYRKVTDGTATTGEVLGLVNGQQYAFSLVGEDLAGNVSGGSDPVDGTPEVVLDFYRRYRCAGGAEKGGFGCSTSTAGALLIPVVGAGILALVRRRRRP